MLAWRLARAGQRRAAARGPVRTAADVVKRGQVRVLSERGKPLGRMPLPAARELAARAAAHLVLFSADPPTYSLSAAAALHVADADGTSLGELPRREAVARARAQGLDLVLVTDGPPPRAKIVDYGRHRYEQAKREKASRANAGAARIKQVRFGAFSEDHDIETKLARVVRFLGQSKSVRVAVHFKRARDFDEDMARETADYLQVELGKHGRPDPALQVQPGRGVSFTCHPQKTNN